MKPEHFRYGFILRARDPRNADFLIESDLLTTVRDLLYRKPVRSLRSKITSLNRNEYLRWRTFLTFKEKSQEQFLALMPLARQHFIRYDALLDSLVVELCKVLRSGGRRTGSPRGVAPSPPGDAIGVLARSLAMGFTVSGKNVTVGGNGKPFTFDINSKNAPAIIKDCIKLQDNAYLFMLVAVAFGNCGARFE
jgi:hypothetical protein